jgi:hypothetical protein
MAPSMAGCSTIPQANGLYVLRAASQLCPSASVISRQSCFVEMVLAHPRFASVTAGVGGGAAAPACSGATAGSTAARPPPGTTLPAATAAAICMNERRLTWVMAILRASE